MLTDVHVNRDQRGLTLIELLIAMTIFAVMAASMFIAFDSIQKSRENGNAAAARLRSYQYLFNRMGQDVQQMVPRPIRDEYGYEVGALVAGTDGNIEFTRIGWTGSSFSRVQRSSLQRVQYYLEGGNLMRAYWHNLDRDPAAQPKRAVMLRGVKALKFRFIYSLQSDALEPNPSEEWPPPALISASTSSTGPSLKPIDQHVALPRAVEVVMTTDDLGEITRFFLVADRWNKTL